MRSANQSQNNSAWNISVRALAFLTNDEALISRFLDITGWTPATASRPEAREALLVASLEYLLSEEDLLLTFSANSGVDPRDVCDAHRILTGQGGDDSQR